MTNVPIIETGIASGTNVAVAQEQKIITMTSTAAPTASTSPNAPQALVSPKADPHTFRQIRPEVGISIPLVTSSRFDCMMEVLTARRLT